MIRTRRETTVPNKSLPRCSGTIFDLISSRTLGSPGNPFPGLKFSSRAQRSSHPLGARRRRFPDPLIYFRRHCDYRTFPSACRTMHREPKISLPTLNGPLATAHILGHFFPGIEEFLLHLFLQMTGPRGRAGSIYDRIGAVSYAAKFQASRELLSTRNVSFALQCWHCES